MKPSWVLKTDPEKHPVRFLASIWQQKMQANFGVSVSMTPKEKGQLKALRLHLGDLTREVIEWIVDPVNWWHFCQQVRAGWKTCFVPPDPHVGFLLAHRGTALQVMRSKLSNSGAGAEFVKKLNQKEFERLKALALVYAEGKAERVAKIEGTTTLADMQKVLSELIDASAANLTNWKHLLKNSA